MSMSEPSVWPKSRIEQGLLWLQRIVLALLLLAALARQDFLRALAVAVALAIHSAVYWAIHRIRSERGEGLAISLLDIVLGGSVFFFSGDVTGLSGILGFCLAGLMAARWRLWWALIINIGIWLLFSLPLFHSWLWLGEPFPPPLFANLAVYLALTYITNYLVSMETRQSRASREVSSRFQQLTTAYEIGQTITSTLEMETVLDLVMAKAVEILNAEAGSLLLLDPLPDADVEEATGDLVFRVVLGPATESLLGQRLSVTEGIAGATVRTGQAHSVNDVQADPRWSKAPDTMSGFETRSILCVPLVSRGRSIGALEVVNKRDNAPFSDEDLELLSTYASQAAIALENARLYDETHRHLQQINTLYEVGRSLSTLDSNLILSIIAEQIVSVLGVDVCAVFLHDLDPSGNGWIELKALHESDGTASSLAGTRFNIAEQAWLRKLAGEAGYATVGSAETDARLDETLRSTLMTLGVRSCLLVGLYAHKEPRGFIVAAEHQATRAFSEDEIQVCQALAHQAVIAIENARLYEKTDEALNRRLRELATIEEIDHELGSTLDYDRAIDLVLERAIEACGASSGAIGILMADGQQLAARFQGSKEIGAAPPPAISEWSIDQGVVGRVVRTGQPALIADVSQDRDYAEVAPATRSELAVPIVREEQVIGVLNLESDHPAAFTQDDLHFMEHLAEHAAIAIENARLFREERQRVQILSAIGEISHEIGVSLDLQRTLDLILNRVKDLVDYDMAEICLWDESRQILTTWASAGNSDYTTRAGGLYRLDEGYTGWIARNQQELLIPDTATRQDVQPKVIAEDVAIRSYVGLPLTTGETFVGTLELASEQTGYYTEDHLEILHIFANHAAVAIRNALLYEQTDERLQARVEEMTAFQRTTQELNATLELDRILQVVLESAIQTIGATHGNVMLVNLETEQFALRAAQGYSDEELASVEETLLDLGSNSLTRQVLESRQARIVDDAHLEPHPVCVRADTRSALAVPIFYEGAIVGIIHLRHTEVEAFDQDSLNFVQALAEQAAIAIGNALRFEEQVKLNIALRGRTEQMTSLLAVGHKLRADVPLEDTLEEVAYAIQESVGFNVVLVSIVEDLESAAPMLRRVAAAGLPLDQFEEAKKVRHPLEQVEGLLREEYRQGSCHFFPFEKRDDWGSGLQILTPMPETEEWEEGHWHRHDMLLVPLHGVGGRLLGHISVDDPRDGRRPSRQTLEALTIFANQAAVAVENATLYADAQRRADNLDLINRMSRALTQLLEPTQVLDTVVQSVAELLQCELSAIFQPDPFDGKLCPVASYGIDVAEISDLCFAPGEGLVGHVAATTTACLIPDTDQEPRFVTGPKPVGAMMLAPIMAGRQLLGVLTAGSTEKYALTQADQVPLATLADQAAVAMESARLFAHTQQAAVRLSLLNEIGRRAASQLELHEMLETTVSALHQNLGYDRVAAFLVEGATEELSVAAANEGFWPLIPDRYRQEVGEGLIGAAAATGMTVLVNDTASDERYRRIGAWDSPASLSVPIKVAGEVIGVLHVEADQRRAFSEEDAAALEIAADQLAVAIHNASLFEETQRRVAELATINEIGRAISSALDADQLHELIYNQVSKLLDCRNFHIALVDPETELIHVEFLMEHGERQPPVILKPGQGLTSYLVRTGQPILLTHGSKEFLKAENLKQEGPPAKSWLGVPMIAEGRAIGAIAVQSYDQESAFDIDHLNLLTTIAGQAAVAFQNVSLFRERDRRINELAVLNEIAQAVSSTLELDELLETVYAQISRLMDTTHFYIATYEEGSDEWTMALQLVDAQRVGSRRFAVDSGLTGYIIRNHERVSLHSLQDNIAFHETHGIEYKGKRARSWMGVPMIAEDKVLGVIAVHSYEQEYAYTDEDLNLLSTVAAQAAAAVRNAQLYQQIVNFSSDLEAMVEARTQDLEQALQELTRQRDRATTLYRITSELGASLELDRVLQRALQLFADALGIEHGTITLIDQETGQLDLRATLEGGRGPHKKGDRTPLRYGSGLAGWVLENRKPALVADITEDPRWLDIPDKEPSVRSVIAAPLSLGGGDILGVITLGHPEVDHFGQEHVQLLGAAAAQVAIAVNNSDLYAFITDQAERVGSMLQAQQAEAVKNRAILESIADGVLVLDHNGRVLLVNPTAEELLGISAIALQGDHFRHMLGLGETPAHLELAQGLYSELRKRLETARPEAESLQPSGVRLEAGSRVLAVTIAPLITEIGGAPGLVAALRDVSREAEVERLKNEFISTVSHELRTPMTSIKGYTDLLFLGMAGGLSDAQRNFLQIIKSNADRLTALVNDILDISRIETGRLRLTIEPLDLGKIVSHVVTSFQEQYRESNLTLEWQVPEDLPEVRGDEARITQVLNNLLANAWHYTPAGGHVSVSIREVDEFLQIDIEDTGIGIAEDDLSRIFDRFYRVDHPVVQETGGTGLGLSIVKMFVEMLGGEIWVDSELDVGSIFHFTVPLVSAEYPEEDVEIPELLTTEPTAVVRRRPKILIVEEDRDLALLLRRQLETERYQVLLAGSGEDALWLAREEQPHLIALDIMLPDMDGFAVLEQLKEHPVTAPIPVIIVSISTEVDKGYALGAVDYVVKPFEEDKLLHSINQALADLEEGKPGKLLVVDDDPDIREFLFQALTYHGYEVSTAPGGWQALELVPQIGPDLILLDIKMPNIDGYEVIRRLKRNEATRHIPIIVITASPVDKERDKVRVLGMGAAQYITKPLSIDSLIREIKSAITGKRPA